MAKTLPQEALEAAREAVLHALDRWAVAYLQQPQAGPKDGDLPDLFAAVDPLVVEMAKRAGFAWEDED